MRNAGKKLHFIKHDASSPNAPVLCPFSATLTPNILGNVDNKCAQFITSMRFPRSYSYLNDGDGPGAEDEQVLHVGVPAESAADDVEHGVGEDAEAGEEE